MSESENRTDEGVVEDRTPSRAERRRTKRHARAEVHQRRAFRRMVPNLLVSVVLFFLIGLIIVEQPIPLPKWARTEIENSVNTQLDRSALRVGSVAVSLGPERGPQVRLRDLQIGEPGGGAAAVLNTVQATLVSSALVRGLVRPESVILDGAQLTLRRDASGGFSVGVGLTEGEATVEISDLLARLDDALKDPTFASIRDVTASGVVITVEDARTNRIWQATNARFVLRRTETGLTLSLTSDVFNGTDTVAEVQFSFGFTSDTRDTSLGMRVENMPAADIAAQSPILSWLGVLDAPLSGAVRAEYDGTDGLTSLAGTLDIAAGALSPVEGSDPQPFDAARAYFRYDPARQRLNFSEVSVQSDSLAIQGTGHTYLTELTEGWPEAFVGQFRVDEVRFADNGLLADAVALSDVTADLRLRLDPFTVDAANVTAHTGLAPVSAKAHVEARSDGWSFSVDASTNAIAPDKVLAFWPLQEARGTRRWLSENVREGRLSDVSAAVRKRPGGPVKYGLTFDVEDATVRFLPDMPPITGGFGRGTLVDDRFTLVLEDGLVELPDGGVIDGAGSVLTVPDVEQKPARGVFDVSASGSVTDVLTLLNRRPVRLLDRIERPADFATGTADIAATFELPLIKDLPAEEVTFAVSATVRDARSEQIIAGRTLTSDAIRLQIEDDEGITASGRMRLDDVPLTATWVGSLRKDAPSRATGRVSLNAETLKSFDVALPTGMLQGETQAEFDLSLPVSSTPTLKLTSNTRGAELRIDALGWTKPRDTNADFDLVAELSIPPRVTGMSLDAPGLALNGTVDLDDDTTTLNLEQVRVGRWLDASARVRYEGNASSVALTGGMLDLRNLPERGGAAVAGRGQVTVSLDNLIVTDSLRLGPFRGDLASTSLGLNGDFQGRLNGGGVVRAVLAPTPNGTGVRIQSNSAGDVLRDARLTPNALGGTLDIAMTPVSGAPSGTYNGQFLIENIALKDAPVMAALLDAASVVGLLNQLGGAGIQFATVDGQFRLTPERLTLRDVAATGVSIGISANGIYDMNERRMDIEGVVSPFYFLNAVGNLVSRRGEGLFGVNYRIFGSASAPRVSVNPLSLLTPGAFRQIFRRSPPTE